MDKTTVGARTLEFWWDLEAWFETEEKMGSIEALARQASGQKQPAQACAVLIAASVNAGFRRRSSDERIDVGWIAQNMGCGAFKRCSVLAKKAFVEGMRREEKDEDEDEAIDVVAEEIKKNETPIRE